MIHPPLDAIGRDREETNGNPHTAKKGISIFTTGISKSTGKLFPNMHNVGGAIPIGKAIEERSEQRAKATEEKRQRAEEITAKKTTKKKKMKLKKVMMPKEVKEQNMAEQDKTGTHNYTCRDSSSIKDGQNNR
ncbi:hypothetical protein BLNAU_3245 [Blattamonas nauphoetae]|uniref:Uncharacterized protein n=1 Tax=Blattamonas nauphoetae TaxID=2049346 RepID=A0ABQ9YDP6_9EUKA|nr:hypothetical protein BLNAU_3245 [Blattamonas nauphoetae]